MVPNYRLSEVFLSCYHIFFSSDYSMPLQKNKNKQRHKQTQRKRKGERYSPWGSDFTVIFKEFLRSMEDSSLAPFAVQCSKVQRRRRKKALVLDLIVLLFLAVSVSFSFFQIWPRCATKSHDNLTRITQVVHNLTNSIESPEYFQLCTQT